MTHVNYSTTYYQHPTDPSVLSTSPWVWRARGNCLMFGAQIIGYRLTALGARFAAWRRRRAEVLP